MCRPIFLATLLACAGALAPLHAATHSAESTVFSLDLRSGTTVGVVVLDISPRTPMVGQDVTLSVTFTPATGETVLGVEYYLLTESIQSTSTAGGPVGGLQYPISIRPVVPAWHVLKAKVYVSGRTAPYESAWTDFRPKAAAADLDPVGEPGAVALGDHNTIGNRAKPARRNVVNGQPTGGFLLQIPRVKTSNADTVGEIPTVADFSYFSSPKWAVVAHGPFATMKSPMVLPRSVILTNATLTAPANFVTNPSNAAGNATRDPDIQVANEAPDLSGRYAIGTVANLGEVASEFQSGTTLAIYRVTRFEGALLDGGRTAIAPAALKDRVIVMVHGWQPTGDANPFEVDQFNMLAGKLRTEVTNTEWSLVGYNWTADASTGNIVKPGLGRAINFNESQTNHFPLLPDILGQGVATPGIKASEIGYQHGLTLGKRLLDGKGSNLRAVHFVAHSAGAWVAYSAVRYLRARGFTGEIQVTLLDPAMVAEAASWTQPANLSLRSGLGSTSMKVLNAGWPAGRIRLGNIFAPDPTGPATGQLFGSPWEEVEIRSDGNWLTRTAFPFVNVVEPVKDFLWWLTAHSYPVEWYADSVDAYTTGAAKLSTPATYKSYGFAQSLFVQSLPKVGSLGFSLVKGQEGRMQLTPIQNAGGFLIQLGAPSWISVSEGGELTFRPPATTLAGLYPFRVQFSNSVATRSQDLSVEVRDSGGAPSAVVRLPPTGTFTQRFLAGSALKVTADLPAQAMGNSNLTVWYREGTPTAAGVSTIAGRPVAAAVPARTQVGTGITLDLASLTAADAGTYYAEVTVDGITYRSADLVVTIEPATVGGRLINLSILTAVGTPGDSFTLGYVVGGAGTSGTKPLVIRAAGPSLGALGVPGTLADPQFELFAGPTRVGANDNWGGAATLANAMAAVGAFAYTGPTSRDAAAAMTVASGDNSVKVSSVGSGTGAVIAEIYDATPSASFTASTPRLVNVSVLKQLGTGFTVGFVVGGNGPRNVLVRAIGPTLGTAFGVSGAVADPQFTLYAGQTATAANDNWGGGAGLISAFTSVGAFALPATSRDAALTANLSPGNYSVQVAGVGGANGAVLVEIYELP